MKFYFAHCKSKNLKDLAYGTIFPEPDLKEFKKETIEKDINYTLEEISEPLFMYYLNIVEENEELKKKLNEDDKNFVSQTMLNIFNEENQTNYTQDDLRQDPTLLNLNKWD